MFERWFRRRKNPQALPVRELHFLCEHDGAPERELKRNLTTVFQSRSDVATAYLAIVSRGADRGVALCLTGVSDSRRLEIVKAAGTVFAALFSAEQHLDIVFPTDLQKKELDRVCRPFFVRGSAA